MGFRIFLRLTLHHNLLETTVTTPVIIGHITSIDPTVQAQLPHLVIKMEYNPSSEVPSTCQPSAAAGSETQLPHIEQEIQAARNVNTKTYVKPFEVRLVRLSECTIKKYTSTRFKKSVSTIVPVSSHTSGHPTSKAKKDTKQSSKFNITPCVVRLRNLKLSPLQHVTLSTPHPHAPSSNTKSAPKSTVTTPHKCGQKHQK